MSQEPSPHQPDPPASSSAASSPLGLAQQVESLMQLPQHLCKQRGTCCRVATFKGSLGHLQIKQLAEQNDIDGEMARDFISVFRPYNSQQEVMAVAPEFVALVRQKATEKGQDPDQISFFKCQYVLEDGRCGVHEDRPIGCRKYPIPHTNTFYHPGCGFEAQGKANWQQIKQILDMLGLNDDGSLKQT